FIAWQRGWRLRHSEIPQNVLWVRGIFVRSSVEEDRGSHPFRDIAVSFYFAAAAPLQRSNIVHVHVQGVRVNYMILLALSRVGRVRAPRSGPPPPVVRGPPSRSWGVCRPIMRPRAVTAPTTRAPPRRAQPLGTSPMSSQTQSGFNTGSRTEIKT